METYQTDIEEVEKALSLADDNRKIIIENKDKAVVIVELSKEQTEELKRKLRLFSE